MRKGVPDSPSKDQTTNTTLKTRHPAFFFSAQASTNESKHDDHTHSYFIKEGSVYLQTYYPDGELIEIKVPPNEIGELSLQAYSMRISEEMPSMRILHRSAPLQNLNLEEKQGKKTCNSDSDNANETIGSDAESDESTSTSSADDSEDEAQEPSDPYSESDSDSDPDPDPDPKKEALRYRHRLLQELNKLQLTTLKNDNLHPNSPVSDDDYKPGCL